MNNAKMDVSHMDLFYGDYQALRDINLSFIEHNVTAMIGPSGCGKSTLLKSLNRMNDLVEGCKITGRITLDGEDIYDKYDVNVLRKKVGMVFQKPNPFPMSIYDKIEELVGELKENYTIIIVTHNMQQAARISDSTAFFLLGEMIECSPTDLLFSAPKDKRTEDYISGRFG